MLRVEQFFDIEHAKTLLRAPHILKGAVATMEQKVPPNEKKNTGPSACHPDVLPLCATHMGATVARLDNIDERLNRGEKRFDKYDAAIQAAVLEIRDATARMNLAIQKIHNLSNLQARVGKLERTKIYSRGFGKGVWFVIAMIGAVVLAAVSPLIAHVVKWIASKLW